MESIYFPTRLKPPSTFHKNTLLCRCAHNTEKYIDNIHSLRSPLSYRCTKLDVKKKGNMRYFAHIYVWGLIYLATLAVKLPLLESRYSIPQPSDGIKRFIFRETWRKEKRHTLFRRTPDIVKRKQYSCYRRYCTGRKQSLWFTLQTIENAHRKKHQRMMMTHHRTMYLQGIIQHDK